MKSTDWFLEAEVGADESQWNGYSEPESKQSDKCAERDRSTAAHGPQHQVEDEEDAKDDSNRMKRVWTIEEYDSN